MTKEMKLVVIAVICLISITYASVIKNYTDFSEISGFELNGSERADNCIHLHGICRNSDQCCTHTTKFSHVRCVCRMATRRGKPIKTRKPRPCHCGREGPFWEIWADDINDLG
ncbi:uncharacterized protein [Parasteatoda tepidariorum]|uniref:uncharacterized protein n=1 Tax=Parasteatoda tepidariorum TaxID=114398 RepID=UPI00077FA04C|nr:uncharacterized protein LOC107450653 [Parasteatoda tepidariorum]